MWEWLPNMDTFESLNDIEIFWKPVVKCSLCLWLGLLQLLEKKTPTGLGLSDPFPSMSTGESVSVNVCL